MAIRTNPLTLQSKDTLATRLIPTDLKHTLARRTEAKLTQSKRLPQKGNDTAPSLSHFQGSYQEYLASTRLSTAD